MKIKKKRITTPKKEVFRSVVISSNLDAANQVRYIPTNKKIINQ